MLKSIHVKEKTRNKCIQYIYIYICRGEREREGVCACMFPQPYFVGLYEYKPETITLRPLSYPQQRGTPEERQRTHKTGSKLVGRDEVLGVSSQLSQMYDKLKAHLEGWV